MLQVSFDPAIQLQAQFDQNNIEGTSGIVNLQSGPVSVIAARGTKGKVVLGGGLHETGFITLGNYGKISVKGMSTMDGMYQAVVDSELFTGQRSLNPIQLTIMRTPNGLQYSGSTSLGYLGGTYEGSDGSFVVNLDSDGWVTANANGVYRDSKIKWKGYNATVNLGIVSAAVNMDDQMKLLDYDVGGSIGIIHGAMHRNRQTNGTSYRAGLNLGIVNFEAFIEEDNSRTYSTQLDTGMMRFAYNADPKNENYNWSGSLNMANMAIDYAQDNEGLTLGGKMQVGSSIITVQRDPKGKFTVKVDRGLMIE